MIKFDNFVNISEPKRIVLSWLPELQDGTPVQSRTRYAVGEISQNLNHSEFTYLYGTKSLSDAKKKGFTEFPAFPLTTERTVYPNCMNVFSRRILNKNRSDFSSHLAAYGVNSSCEYSDFHLLSLTGGRSSNDTFEFVDPLESLVDNSIAVIEVAGTRHYPTDFSALEPGQSITFLHDSSNTADSNAVGVLNTSGDQLGWINRIQSPSILSALSKHEVSAKVFRLNGRVGYRRIFIMVTFNSKEKAAA